MQVRRATEADEATWRELWHEFEREVPEPDDPAPWTWEEEWADVRADLAGGAVYVAEEGGEPVGIARATAPARGGAHLVLVYVRPFARGRGVAKALVLACLREAKERGATRLSLDVLDANPHARGVWRSLGFTDVAHVMRAPVEALEARLREPRP